MFPVVANSINEGVVSTSQATLLLAEAKVAVLGDAEGLRKRIKEKIDGQKLMLWFPILNEKKALIGKVLPDLQDFVLDQLNKGHDVTDEEFIAYGAILKIEDGETRFQRRPDKDEKEDFYASYPSTVEPGDYYSEDNIGVDSIITGNAMTRLLKRYHLWPRAYGGKSELDNRKKLLIKMAIKHHKDKDPKDIVKKVISLSPKETDDFFYRYQKLTNIEL
jgi:hypothetical protein